MKIPLLMCFIWFLVLDAHGAVKHEIPIRSQRSLRQQVDSYAELLQKESLKAKNRKEVYQSLNRVLGQIKSLRDNNAPQGALDESHMDLVVSVLEALPQQSKFKKQDCLKYENDLLSQFEPMAEEVPQEPAVQPGWTVLQSLCR